MIPQIVIRRGFGEFTLKHALRVERPERALALSAWEAEEIVREWCQEVTTWPDAVRLYEELSSRYVCAPTSGDVDGIIERLQHEVSRGELAVLRMDAPARRPFPGRPRPRPDPQPPPLPPPKLLARSFAIRLVDELGQPIAGIDLMVRHAGSDALTTDGNGVARVEDSPASTASARFVDPKQIRKALKPRWDKPRSDRKWLDESQGVTVVELNGMLPKIDLIAEKLRVVSIQPFVARARLEGGYFDTDKAFVVPGGLDGTRGTLAMFRSLDRPAVLVVGHTDTSGRASYNDRLSVERAQAMADLLLQNVEGWTKWYKADAPSEKRWGPHEDALMLGALPDAAERPPDESPVRWFQRTRGLEVDGIAGPKTRAALVAEYMALSGDPLPRGTKITVHGCGENFPRDDTGDGVDDPENRRVEVFFFDADLGVQPPPSGPNSKAGAPEYSEWERRVRQFEDFLAGASRSRMQLRLHIDPDELEDSRDRVRLFSDDAEFDEHRAILDDGQSSDAYVDVRFVEVPADRAYTIAVGDPDTGDYLLFEAIQFARLNGYYDEEEQTEEDLFELEPEGRAGTDENEEVA